MVKREKLIISNWKNYIENEAQARDILDAANDILESLSDIVEPSLVFCPKNELLMATSVFMKDSHLEHSAYLGAQDLPEDVMDGLRYVILGHSSRRYGLGEINEVVNAKIIKALEKELIPVVCIGEKYKGTDAEEFIRAQILGTFRDLSSNQIGHCIVVYEPVWAITNDTNSESDNPNDAAEKINFIKRHLAGDPLKILYGGSVNCKNVDDFLKEEAIEGALIGKASTIKSEFQEILLAVAKFENEND